MNSPPKLVNRKRAWLRWILFSEGLILLFALAGPGYRYTARRSGDHGLIARWFAEDPTFFDAVIVNLLVFHLFLGGVSLAAWIVTRARQRR